MSETMVAPDHPGESHENNLSGKLNWLRAGVLGANDGIVSVAGVVVGVAGASSDLQAILTAGVAATVAGAFSMAGGEYVSVSTQRDTEEAAIRLERTELRDMPEAELDELAGIYRGQGLSPDLAHQVAQELTAKDALQAHVRMELGIDLAELANPWSAAFASFVAFAVGALLPMVAISLPIGDWRVVACFAATIVGMMLTGMISARLGGAHVGPAVLRNAGVGILTLVVTYGIGSLFDVAVG
jgi:VIT1/CCC1 family predicted Fe2+/Mn2+ transporter